MVFNSKSNEVEEEDENEISQELSNSESDSSDGASASKPNKNFLSSINWQENDKGAKKKDSIDDSDDDFGNLRNGDHNTAVQSSSQAHDFFYEREGMGTIAQGDIDLFNMKSPSSDELNEHLFNLDDSDSDADEPVISKQTANVDLLNIGSKSHTEASQDRQGMTVNTDARVTVVDDIGVDLLNLSPGKKR